MTFETQKMVAEQVANQTVILARGTANKIVQQAQANAQIVAQTVAAEMSSYGNLSQALGFGASDALDYVWWDTLQSAALQPGKADGKEFLIGLEPAAYISGGTRGGGGGAGAPKTK